ncbi:hypothetical protein H6Y38_004393 [Escherichia coli]|nr:hypothetical protein [Escherichia coli]HAL0882638.1 hypothetical protein [Escherichia coli]
MRWSILAGVQASAAVMAQICQIVNVGFAKFQSLSHCREHGAKSFAIATCVMHHPLDFSLWFGENFGLNN